MIFKYCAVKQRLSPLYRRDNHSTIGLIVIIMMPFIPLNAADFSGSLSSYEIKQDENLLTIARHFNLGYVELIAALPNIDPWQPEPNTVIQLPTLHIIPDAEKRGVVINLGDFRLYWFSDADKTLPENNVESWPIAIAREGFATPLGKTQVVKLRDNPSWMPTQSARHENPVLPFIVPPGPTNPLGRLAINLGFHNIIIHGTNKPWGIGRRVSRGCIRMYPEDIAQLYQRVKIGTPVAIINQPIKFGWHNKQLYVEIHPSWKQVDQLEYNGHFDLQIPTELAALVRKKAGSKHPHINWLAVVTAARERSGIPVRILD